MMRSFTRTIVWVSVFAVAMGFMESAVVIYLRESYYPGGFSFPLRPMPLTIARVEILREVVTVIMLVSVGCLAGNTKCQRFAYFTLAFAIWDVFYYVFLYLLIDWPESLFTQDILFLIPGPWVGPVWAPCLLSLLMITGSLFVIVQIHKNAEYLIRKKDWLLLLLGTLICIVSFIWDYLWCCASGSFNAPVMLDDLQAHAPKSFQTSLFFAGFALMCWPVMYYVFLNHKTQKS